MRATAVLLTLATLLAARAAGADPKPPNPMPTKMETLNLDGVQFDTPKPLARRVKSARHAHAATEWTPHFPDTPPDRCPPGTTDLTCIKFIPSDQEPQFGPEITKKFYK